MKLGKNFAFQFNSEILKIFQERWFSIACYIMAFYKGVTRVCTFEDNGDVNPKIVYFACAIRNMRKQNILYKKKNIFNKYINVAITYSPSKSSLLLFPQLVFITQEFVSISLSELFYLSFCFIVFVIFLFYSLLHLQE